MAVTQESRSTGVAKTTAAGIGIVGKHYRKSTWKSGEIDLDQLGIGAITNYFFIFLSDGSVGKIFLQAIHRCCKWKVLLPSFIFKCIYLINFRQIAIFTFKNGFEMISFEGFDLEWMNCWKNREIAVWICGSFSKQLN